MSQEKRCEPEEEREVSSENSGRGAGDALTGVFAEKVTPRPESFPQPFREHSGPTKKDTPGQGGGWYFLFNLHSVFVKFIYKQITSLFTVHEHRDSTVSVM